MSFLMNNAAQSGALQSTGATRSVRSKQTGETTEGTTSSRTPVGGEEADSRFRPGSRQARSSSGQAGAQTGKTRKKLVKRRKVRSGAARTGSGKSTGKTTGKQTAKASQGTQQQMAPQQAQSRGTAAKNSLMSQSLTNQASVKFEQTQQQQSPSQQNNPFSPAGQRRNMLNNLSNMVRTSLAQHTGGQAGEAYPRRETRQILMALQGLKSSADPNKTDNKDSGKRISEGEFKLRESSVNSIMAIFVDPPTPPEGYEPVQLIA